MKAKKIERKIRTTNLRRIAYFDRESVDTDARTVALAFSSEQPVERWFGSEILDHGKGSIRMDRLKDTGPLLLNHDSREHIGTVETAKINNKDRVGRAVVRLGAGADRDAILQDIEDGIRKCVSVGYRIHRMKLEEGSDEDADIYRATDWEPYEISLVSMPADTAVGVGREARQLPTEDEEHGQTIIIETIERETEMKETPEQKAAREAAERAAAPAPAPTVVTAVPDTPDADAIRAAERTRVRVIGAVGEKYGQRDLADQAIADGTTVADFNERLLESLPGARKVEPEAMSLEDNNIGLTRDESKKYSFLKMIRAQAWGDKNPKYIEAAAFELECSRAAADKQENQAQGYIVPTDALLFGDPDRSRDWRAVRALQELLSNRAQTVAAPGASIIAEDLLAGSFIDLLRNRSILSALGITTLDGLQGNVAIPRQTGAGTAIWLASDTTAVTDADQTMDQVTLTPRNVGAWTTYTRQLLLQSSISIEQFVRNDLATVLALAIDLAGLYGSGAAGQPTGVANTAGINAPGIVAAGAPTFAELVGFETAVAVDNALLGNLAYVIEATMRGYAKTTEKVATTAQYIWEPGNTLNGHRTEVTQQVTANDVFFGNWADLLQGVWGGLDVLIDPYTLGTSMQTRVIEFWTTDFAVRHPESFAFDS